MSRRIIIVFCLLGAHLVGAQVQGGQNQNTNNTTIQQDPATYQADTVVIEELEISKDKSAPGRKKLKASSYERSAAPQTESIEAPAQTVVMDASAGFEQSKSMSSSQRIQRTPTGAQQKAMDDAVKSLENSAPNSFEYHYYKYVAGNYNVSLIDHLNKAEAIRPNNTDVQIQKAAYYHIKKNSSKTKEYLNKLVTSKRLDDKLKFYAEDLLLSVPKNGTLVTHGFDDTYSVLYTQLKFSVRTDVRVISLDMIQSEEYRNTLKAEGYVIPSRTTVDVSFFKEFVSKNESKNIAVSLTTPKEYFKPIQGSLYLTGLVFEYHSSDYDNLHQNQTLWEKKLKKYPVEKATDEKLKELSSNYLPMLLVLYKHYKSSGETDKLESVDSALTKVSVQCGKYETVKRLKDSY